MKTYRSILHIYYAAFVFEIVFDEQNAFTCHVDDEDDENCQSYLQYESYSFVRYYFSGEEDHKGNNSIEKLKQVLKKNKNYKIKLEKCDITSPEHCHLFWKWYINQDFIKIDFGEWRI